MSERELVEEIHSCLSGSDMHEGISLCFDLATAHPDQAAKIFTSYRPKIIEALYGWARDVNEHRGVFLPHNLFRSEVPDAYEEMWEFEAKFAGTIDVQAQDNPLVRQHVDTAKTMEAHRQAITEAIERRHTDRELRNLCGTDDPEHLHHIETTAIEIALSEIKGALKKNGPQNEQCRS